jgi:hypothetical protein
MAAAGPLSPRARDVFLQEVAVELRRYQEIGPGLVGRIVREVQRRHFDPPIMGRPSGHQQLG